MNNKIGVIYLSYGRPELEEKALEPFLSLRKDGLCKIAAASSIFPEYSGLIEDKQSFARLKKFKDSYEIDYLYNNSIVFSESSIRTVCLNQLKDCELILLWDADEFVSKEDLIKLINFVDKFPEIYYFDIAFKNYVFDNKHYLDIIYFKRLFRNFKHDPAKEFYWDCDLAWQSGKDIDKTRMKVPADLFTVKHLSWPNSHGKIKCEYQAKHFGNAIFCSFKWDETKNTLVFNEEHYLKFNKPIPQIYTED